MRMSRTNESLTLRKVLKKYNSVKLLSREDIDGDITISSVRFYGPMAEIDIEFKGKIYARKTLGKTEWFDASVLPNASKVRVYRLIRRRVFPFLKTHLSYFDINLHYVEQIKKVRWV
jgi:hypothetical protein